MVLTLEKKKLIARVPGVARSIELRVPRAKLPDLECVQACSGLRGPDGLDASPCRGNDHQRRQATWAREEAQMSEFASATVVDGSCPCSSTKIVPSAELNSHEMLSVIVR
jgi:hypothetical protein